MRPLCRRDRFPKPSDPVFPDVADRGRELAGPGATRLADLAASAPRTARLTQPFGCYIIATKQLLFDEQER
jgi:hypothetical protein